MRIALTFLITFVIVNLNYGQEGFNLLDSLLSEGQDIIENTNDTSLNHYDPRIENLKFEINKKAFEWQHISSILIFCLVSIIVIMGLVLSYLQFKRSGESNAKLELGKEGVKIDTAVIGLVILVISLSFFFMYLKYVYPINTVVID